MKRTLIFTLLIIASISSVLAQGIVGVSPSTYTYNQVLRGGYSERVFTISFSGEDPVEASIEPMGEIASWITLEDNSSTVSKDDPWRAIVAIEPPSDIPNGNYTGFFRIRTSTIGRDGSQGHATGNILAVLDVALQVNIVDFEIIECRATNFGVTSVEKGDDIIFGADVMNEGNVRLRPRFAIDLWDQDQITIVKSSEHLGDEILPTRQERIDFEVSTDDLDIGQYWAEVTAIDCFDSSTLTLDVYEPGALRAQGVLREIIAPVWADEGDTIQIFALFDNIGEKEVDAEFKGQIQLGDKIVQILDSELTSVPIAASTNFSFFFTPNDQGRYVVSGRVFYDKKRTFESSKVINVRGKGISLRTVLIILAYIVVAILILLMYFKIRKERRKFIERLKGIR